MEKYGLKDIFEIWVDYYYISFKDDPEFLANPEKYQTGGDIYFWVNGKNIFALKGKEIEITHEGNVEVLYTFYINNLKYHITEDPFPVECQSNNAREMMHETRLVDEPDNDVQKYANIDWDSINMDERRKIDFWNSRHGLLRNSGQFILPHAYFRKVGDKVEISWRDEEPKLSSTNTFTFKHPKGVEYVDIKLFKDTITAFCLDYIDRFKDKYPSLQKDRSEFQKTIDITV